MSTMITPCGKPVDTVYNTYVSEFCQWPYPSSLQCMSKQIAFSFEKKFCEGILQHLTTQQSEESKACYLCDWLSCDDVSCWLCSRQTDITPFFACEPTTRACISLCIFTHYLELYDAHVHPGLWSQLRDIIDGALDIVQCTMRHCRRQDVCNSALQLLWLHVHVQWCSWCMAYQTRSQMHCMPVSKSLPALG